MSEGHGYPPKLPGSTAATSGPSATVPTVADVPSNAAAYSPGVHPMQQTSGNTALTHLPPTTNAQSASHSSTNVPEPSVEIKQEASDIRSSPPPPLSPSGNKQPATSSQPNGYRPLNVKDALTYLDQVKIQFSDQPEIYNKFLDIMKDFKSQTIDTPGVISRVSSLFHGRPTLISGFNTFLPPGYRIDCSMDSQSRCVIKVTTPSGTTVTADREPLQVPASSSSYPGDSSSRYYRPYTQEQPAYNSYRGEPTSTPMASRDAAATSQSPSSYNHPHHTPPQTQEESSENRRSPVEFNHAINYVNKIKTRFVDYPDTYKQFLEILQTYQKEQKPIQEVYAQVQVLFDGATDLLEEFKQFLPESPSAAHAPAMSTLLGAKRGSIPGISTSRRKRSAKASDVDVQISSVRSGATGGEDEEMQLEASRPLVSAEEVEFFDRVKKYIGNKTTYNAFLRLLNLFTQQIVDQNLLVTRVEGFIGGNRELFEYFKKLVGYDGKDVVIENQPLRRDKPDTSRFETYGPSYRRVPKELRRQQRCSGRDLLCREVLNDEYVSHPRWVSEDGKYISYKRNYFEEALHRVEDERYDYDLSIEANLNTIALLEPIAKKISVMSPEEKENFRLPLGLGGPSKAIYQHVIKKIYGEERGREVIELLHENPVPTVPLLLKRLKQKDDEWKRAQREWNKIWRELEANNYYKALDHQGVTFKTSDKKAMTSKALIEEIENIRKAQPREHMLVKGSRMIIADGYSRVPPQFLFDFPDKVVFRDVSRLVVSFLERQEVYSPTDCERLRTFLESFIPLLFAIQDASPLFEPLDDEDVDMADRVDVMDEDGDEPMGEVYEGTRLRRRQRSGNNSSNHKNKTDSESKPKSVKEDKEQAKTSEESVQESGTMVVDEPDATNGITFFGNKPFYCFLRLYQLLYERLVKFKQLAQDYQTEPEKTKTMTKAALDFGLPNITLHGVDLNFSHGYYYALLDLIDTFFDGSIDQAKFEECARYIFGTKAYIIFTIDKLVMLLTRHLHSIACNNQTLVIMEIFKQFRNKGEGITAQQLGRYKSRVEQEVLAMDEHIFGFVFDPVARLLSIQLLDEDDYPLETDARAAYTEYVTNYSDFNVPTEGINHDAKEKQFLKRNLLKRNTEDDVCVYPGMQYKISKASYHLFYIIDSEDSLIRKRRRRRSNEGSSSSEWRRWLESDKGWSVGIEDKEKAEQEALKRLANRDETMKQEK